MPSHWTYSEFGSNSDLCQGDIFRRSPELLSVLKIVHSHFCDEKYTAFMILTQTCDLVRRKGDACSARHVSLCVIRELDLVLPQLLADICGTEIPGVYSKEGKFFAEQLLVRLINQNEQARGLFYLHPDADVGVATPSVALLRISIALRREHYDVLTTSRSGRVAPEFAAKLGWLTGNLYARVATPDWDEKEGSNSAKQVAKSLLDSVSDSQGRNWIPGKWLEAARSANTDFSQLDRQSAFDALQSHAPAEPIEVITDRIDKVSREVLIAEQAPKLRDHLRDDDQFIASVVSSVVDVVLPEVPLEQIDLPSLLQTDSTLRDALANQVQATFKRQGRENPDEPVAATCTAVGQLKGLIPPALKVIKNVLGTNGVDDSTQAKIETQLSAKELYQPEAIERVRVTAAALFSDGTLERIQKVIGRLRNDQQVKTALRSPEIPLLIE